MLSVALQAGEQPGTLPEGIWLLVYFAVLSTPTGWARHCRQQQRLSDGCLGKVKMALSSFQLYNLNKFEAFC